MSMASEKSYPIHRLMGAREAMSFTYCIFMTYGVWVYGRTLGLAVQGSLEMTSAVKNVLLRIRTCFGDY